MHEEWEAADRPLKYILQSSGAILALRGWLIVVLSLLMLVGPGRALATEPPSEPSSATRITGSVPSTTEAIVDPPSLTVTTSPGTLTLPGPFAPSERDTATAMNITSVSPSSLPRTAGSRVEVTGTGLANVTAATIDKVSVVGLLIVSDTEVTFTTPRNLDSATSAVVELLSETGSVSIVLPVAAPLVTPTVDPGTGAFILKYRDLRSGLSAIASVGDELDPRETVLEPGEQLGLRMMTVLATETLTADESARVVDELRSDPRVEWVEPDVLLRSMSYPDPTIPPNDPSWASQQWQWWGTYGVGIGAGATTMGTAWSDSLGSGAVVAVLDTGITNHEDLPGTQTVSGYDFVSSYSPENSSGVVIQRCTNRPTCAPAFVDGDGDYVNTVAYGALGRDPNPYDPGDWNARNSIWHGTLITGIIGAATNNGLGVAAVGPSVRIQPVRVASWPGALLSDLIAGINWAAGVSIAGVPANSTPAQVINLSLASSVNDTLNFCPAGLLDSISTAVSRGTVVVAAAGNDNVDARRVFPATCPGVIAVGATESDGKKSGYSNFGPAVDLSAPGTLFGTYNGGVTTPTTAIDVYDTKSGTSFAAPMVAGAAALLKSWDSSLTPGQIETLLVNNTRAFGGGSCSLSVSCGSGILDVSAALQAAAPVSTGTSLAIRTGNNLSAVTGTALTTPLSVTVLNSSGNPVRGVSVTYAVVEGGGSVSGSSVVTGNDGVATLGTWTLGASPGTNTLRASISGTATSVLFSATGTSGGGGGGGGSSGGGGSGGGGGVDAAITEMRPALGPLSGGNTVLILGFGFWGVSGVSIGGKPVPSYTVIDAATIRAVVPPGTALGSADVIVNLAVGRAFAGGGYVYVADTPSTGGGGPILGPTAQLGSIGVGQVSALLDGVAVPARSAAVPDRLALEITGSAFTMILRAMQFGGGAAELSDTGALRVQPSQRLTVAGTGYAPGTAVQVYAANPLRAVGALTAGPDGTVNGSLVLPADLTAGPGALQINGVAPSGAVRSISVGVTIRAKAQTTGTKITTTVNFAAGSAVLSPAAKKKLRGFWSQVPVDAETSVVARGFAPKATPPGDARVARVRADAVVDYVRSIGLRGEGYASGTGRSAVPGAPARRVSVTVTYVDVPRAQAAR